MSGLIFFVDQCNVLTIYEDQKQHLYKILTQEQNNFPLGIKKNLVK